MPGERGRHAVPYFLTLGTPRLTDQQDSWNQLWKVPIADWGDANLDMTITIKQRVNDRLLTTVRTKMDWPAGKPHRLYWSSSLMGRLLPDWASLTLPEAGGFSLNFGSRVSGRSHGRV